MTHTLFPLLASAALSLSACASGSSGYDSAPFDPLVAPTEASPGAPPQPDATTQSPQSAEAGHPYSSAPPEAPAEDAVSPDALAEAASTGSATLSTDDGSGPDDSGPDDSQPEDAVDAYDAPAAPVTPSTPSPGDLVISEVMYAPSGPLPDFQWFEVCNLTGGPLLLSGLTIDDGQGDLADIAQDPPVVLDPYAFALLVRSRAGAAAAQLPSAPIAYEYGAAAPAGQGIQLATDATGDVALWSGSTLLADVPYGAWGLAAPGQSIELAFLQYAGADQPGSWCAAAFPWGPGTDDGTPGQPSDCF